MAKNCLDLFIRYNLKIYISNIDLYKVFQLINKIFYLFIYQIIDNIINLLY